MGRRRGTQAVEGYTVGQLAAAAGVAPRTIHFWVRRGVVGKPRFRGRGTRYPHIALARIHVMRDLQRQDLELREIRRRLDNMTPEEIEAWAARLAAPETAPAATAPAQTNAPPVDVLGIGVGDRWRRVVLLPGLELHVREDGGRMLASIAADIAQRYAVAT